MKKLLFMSVMCIMMSNTFALSIPGSSSTPSSFLPQIPWGPIQSSFTPSRISTSPINGSSSGLPNFIFNIITSPVSSF